MTNEAQQKEVFDHVLRTLSNLALDFWYTQMHWFSENDPRMKATWRERARQTSHSYVVEESAFLLFAKEQGIDGRAFLDQQPAGEKLRHTSQSAQVMAFTADELTAGAFEGAPTVEERLKKMRWWLKEG